MYTTALLPSPAQPWEQNLWISFKKKKKKLLKVLKFLNEPIAPKTKNQKTPEMQCFFTFKMVAIITNQRESLKIFSPFLFLLNLQVPPPTLA